MQKLRTLHKSITLMSREEGLALILGIRNNRRTVVKKITVKKTSQKRATSIEKRLSEQSPEALKKLYDTLMGVQHA